MEVDFPQLQWIVGQGGVTALALVAIVALSKVWKMRAAEQAEERTREREALQRQIAREREDKTLLLDVVNNNTAALASNTDVMREVEVVLRSINGGGERR